MQEVARKGVGRWRVPLVGASMLTVGGWLAFLVVALIFPQIAPVFWVQFAIDLFVLTLFGLSLNLLMGYGGMVSFGHAAYYALGAYAAALLVKRADVPMPLALALGPFFAAGGAMVFGFFAVRLTAIYFAMLTLAFSQIVYAVVFKWTKFTGGDDGIQGVWPIRALAAPPVSDNYYYFTLGVVLVCTLILYLIVNSPFGYTLRAVRENPRRAEMAGVNVRLHQWVAFVIAGFFAGVAGSLFVFFQGSVNPDYAGVARSTDPLIVALLGGMHHFLGPAVGALLYKIIFFYVGREFPFLWQLLVGLILVGVILLFPGGVMGFLTERRWRTLRWWPRKAGATPTPRETGPQPSSSASGASPDGNA
ncbi:MAG: branched-chain amino acid ABC transporter permease [Dehalococcoidia bacterium]|nr:branched-chain amino acid ABC transporter permease [Dehalococcoidia bacterium]MDW8119595.1 branched-chain amino acid ABC transporter permease [Chloroflexota bacterium]